MDTYIDYSMYCARAQDNAEKTRRTSETSAALFCCTCTSLVETHEAGYELCD